MLKLPHEGDITEFFPFLSFNESLSVARWALAHFLEGLTENAAVVHARDIDDPLFAGSVWAFLERN